MSDKMIFTDNITIKFEGDNSISVQQLFGCISGIEIAYQTCLKSKYEMATMDLRVVAINKGSFEIALKSLVDIAPTLLTTLPESVEVAKTLLSIIKLKLELKGKKPQAVKSDKEIVAVTNHEGETSYHDCNIYNLYFEKPTIDAGLSEAFKALQLSKDTKRDAVNFITGEDVVKIKQEEYNGMSSIIIDETEALEDDSVVQKRTVKANLRIRKLDFVGDTLWSFIDEQDKTISALIEDNDFLSSVRDGSIKLSANDVLYVSLRVEITSDKYMRPQKTKYFIETVHETRVKEKVEQTSLNIE